MANNDKLPKQQPKSTPKPAPVPTQKPSKDIGGVARNLSDDLSKATNRFDFQDTSTPIKKGLDSKK